MSLAQTEEEEEEGGEEQQQLHKTLERQRDARLIPS